MRIIRIAFLLAAMAIPVLAQNPGWIGISIDDQTDRGAVVRRVERDSPAEKAGLKEGDTSLEFNKETVVGAQQLTRLVRETPVGRTVDLKIRRDNRDETVKVTTTDTASAFRSGRVNINVPNINLDLDRVIRDSSRSVQIHTTFSQSGLRVEELTDQLRDFFGAPSTGGVLITSVDSGSDGDKAGLKAADVITSIDGRTIRTPNDFSREMRANSKPVMKVIRDKKEREIRFQ
jgi:serine protease Do